ncbi:hypothetical protein [Stackebrandtia soli]|uniref:hypothetical protein n=1 Tax=Stackebrandtia soli TaxID=1892856 RepID=UPI0039EB640D
MGSYRQLMLAVSLRKSTPDLVISVLRRMFGEPYDGPLPTHPLFSTKQWEYMLYAGDTYYSPVSWKSALVDNGSNYDLVVHYYRKDSTSETFPFLDWIAQYVEAYDAPQYVGHTRLDHHEHPTLIYMDGRTATLVDAATATPGLDGWAIQPGKGKYAGLWHRCDGTDTLIDHFDKTVSLLEIHAAIHEHVCGLYEYE